MFTRFGKREIDSRFQFAGMHYQRLYLTTFDSSLRLFPNYGSPPPLRPQNWLSRVILDIKDAQCAKKNDGRKILYRVWAPQAPQKFNLLQK